MILDPETIAIVFNTLLELCASIMSTTVELILYVNVGISPILETLFKSEVTLAFAVFDALIGV